MLIIMKTLLTLFVLLFSFSVVADDIRDFQIEGISLGDSLLDYFSEEEIIESKKRSFNYKDKFIQIGIYQKNSKFVIYDKVSFIVKKNDRKYIIYGLTGVLYFENNIEDCYEQKDKIILDLSNIYKNNVNKVTFDDPHSYDKSGKSKVNGAEFWFDTGDLSRVFCTDWSEEFEKQKNYGDSLKVVLNLKKFADFLMHEFYK
jgi:hypothetical protein